MVLIVGLTIRLTNGEYIKYIVYTHRHTRHRLELNKLTDLNSNNTPVTNCDYLQFILNTLSGCGAKQT